MNNEEIINALKIIKNECNSNTRCQTCPFSDNNQINNCKIIMDLPYNWNINEKIDVWRAFK